MIPYSSVFSITIGRPIGEDFAFIQRFANPNPTVQLSIHSAFLLGNIIFGIATDDGAAALREIQRKSDRGLDRTFPQLSSWTSSRIIYLLLQGMCLYNLVNDGASNIGSLQQDTPLAHTRHVANIKNKSLTSHSHHRIRIRMFLTPTRTIANNDNKHVTLAARPFIPLCLSATPL